MLGHSKFIECTQYMQLASGEEPLTLQKLVIEWLSLHRTVCLGEDLPWDELISHTQSVKYADGDTEPQYFKHVKSFSGIIHLDSEFSREYEYFNNSDRVTGTQLLERFPQASPYLGPMIRDFGLQDKLIIVPKPVARMSLTKSNKYERLFLPEKEWMTFKKIFSDKGKTGGTQFSEEFQSSYLDDLLFSAKAQVAIPQGPTSDFVREIRERDLDRDREFDETIKGPQSSNPASSDGDDDISIPNFEGSHSFN